MNKFLVLFSLIPNKNKARVISHGFSPEFLPTKSPSLLAWSIVPSLSWGHRALLGWWADFYASLPQAKSRWHPLGAELLLLLNGDGNNPLKKTHPTAQWQYFQIIRLEEGACVRVGRGRKGLNKEINFSLKARREEGTCEWLFKWHH